MDTEARLRQELNAGGIKTLDELIQKLAKDHHFSEPPLLGRAGSPEKPPKPGDVSQRVAVPHPRVPIVLDGVLQSQAELIAAAHKTPLFYTPIRNGGRHAVAVFSSREAMIKERTGVQSKFGPHMIAMDIEHICTEPPDSLPEQVCFYSDINQGGDVICLGPDLAYPDLTRVGRDKVFWWYINNWNDCISSVSQCRYNVSLYWDINYGGAEFWLQAGCNLPDLTVYGWNDEASTIVNWGP
jgi:hypothetical protein